MKFDLVFMYDTCNIDFKETSFPECKNIEEARSWLNKAHKFIDIDNIIINVDRVLYITIKESDSQGEQDPPNKVGK